jgi:hypothetical protein
MLLITLKKHQGWPHACVFVFVSQLKGANFPVAETFMNNVSNGAFGKIKHSFQFSNIYTSACTSASISWTRSADVDGRPLLCSSLTFTRPLSNSLHHSCICCTVITLAPYTVASSRWISTGGTFFAHKKEWQNALLLSNLSVWSPCRNYCCVCSCYLRWWLLLLSGGEYMY